MQRLRIGFARTGPAKYISHLDLARMWERALRRAGWRLAYSRGFNPHPRIFFAAPLSVGVASEAELIDVYLEEPRRPADALAELARQMPEGVDVRSVEEVPLDAPPLQRLMVAAEYEALCPPRVELDDLRSRVQRLLAATSLPRVRSKEGTAKSYDLRPLLRALSVSHSTGGGPLLRMELRTDAEGAGRPDEVLRELGLDPADCEITRTRLLLAAETATDR